jgi:hypothetical protein
MSLILAHKKRKLIRDITIKDADGATVNPGANDTVRIKIGRVNATPLLDISSASDTANGSKVTKNSPSTGKNRLEIDQRDMDTLNPGVYTLEVSLVDNADAQAIKHVDRQIIVVQAVPLGTVAV